MVRSFIFLVDIKLYQVTRELEIVSNSKVNVGNPMLINAVTTKFLFDKNRFYEIKWDRVFYFFIVVLEKFTQLSTAFEKVWEGEF